MLKKMSPQLSNYFDDEIQKSVQKKQSGNFSSAWQHLERAHIGQCYVVPHIRVHLKMLKLALITGGFREIIGQLLRLLLAIPGSLPIGNTGRANVPLSKSMEISQELNYKINLRMRNDLAR